jgi:hypothetical protein
MKLLGRFTFRSWAAFAAASFIVFFIWIVVIADRGNGTPWWSFIERIPYGDKVGHLGLIGMLSFLCNLAFPLRQPGFLPRSITVTTLILFVLLSLEELSQGFIKTRHLDFYDWLADLAGLAIGQVSAMKMRIKLRATTAP